MAKDTFQIENTEEALVSKGMGTIETIGGTASQTYTAGSYFVGNDGFMYQADTDLTTADTLVSSGTGKNCTKTDIATELEKVNSEYATLSNTLSDHWGTVNLFNKYLMADVATDLQYKTLTLKANTTYTASTDLPINSNNNANFFAYNSSGSANTNTNGLWQGQIRNITTGSDGIVIVAYRTVNFTNTSVEWFLNHNFQIEEGTTATAFHPYAKPNTELTKDTKGLTDNQFENGCVNLLPHDATSNVQTGLTYIVEDDGTIKVSGTNTSDETAQIIFNNYIDWDSTKRYRISGCPSNGSSSSYRLGLTINKSSSWSRTLTELGDGLEFQLASDENRIKVSINISAGYAISGTLTFKPMITVADVPNSDYAHYVPYAKSNKELTDALNLFTNAIDREITNSTPWSDLENMGTYVMNGVPWADNWAIVLVIKRNNNTGIQFAFCISAQTDVSNNFIMYRLYYSGTYSNWAKINSTNVLPS